jgi:hypothetical protein
MTKRLVGLIALIALGLQPTLTVTHAEPPKKSANKSEDAAFQTRVQPLLSKYCFTCHGEKKKGELDLRIYSDVASVQRDRAVFEKVLKNLQSHEMPPENRPQPTPEERRLIAAWIESEIFQCDCDNPDPGRVTIRRLNREEYNNTIRDLVGIDFRPADDFPADDSGYGFDNIGDVLSLPPVLLEKYLDAAQRILDAALSARRRDQPQSKRFPVDLLEVGYNAKQRGDGSVALNSVEEDDVAANYMVAVDGEYALRVKAFARQDSTNSMKLTFMLDKQPVTVVEVETNAAAQKIYETRLRLPAGKAHLRAVVRRIKDGLAEQEALKWKTGPEQKGAVFVEWLEVEGPVDPVSPAIAAAHRRIFFLEPTPTTRLQTAREIVGAFARRAYRRPVSLDETDRLMKLFELGDHQGESFEGSVKVALTAVLVSPHFLFRGELQSNPNDAAMVHPIDEFALASRLSYFLWSSMPDEELTMLAAQGRLRKNLEPQVRRMLKNPKSQALVENFAGQWLQLRNIKLVAPDRKMFPDFDDSLRDAMGRETELFFRHIMTEDRSILDFLAADYTFVNERLARFYGIGDVKGDEFQRVSLKGTQRGGLLTQASVLTLTSNPTRTSPVKRGKWVLENLLGAPPPPPPPDVPELKDGGVLTGSLRRRMEQHRENPLCASCHARMDPIGFGMENFDGIGAWREKDGEFDIDPSGKLVTGEAFNGVTDLKAVLLKLKRDEFVRCLTEKMLTYALGRGLEYYDKCAVEQTTKRLAKNRYKFSTLVTEIVKSTPFQMRRGDGTRLTQAER